jgi:8-oxo-dGTP pyrophosphatase MutT (NUDIX family)
MSILDRVMACNHFDANTVYPFYILNQQLGWVMKGHEALLLQQWPEWFSFESDSLHLRSFLDSYTTRTNAFAQIVASLRAQKKLSPWQSEYYDVVPWYGHSPYLALERSVTSFWGVPTFGTHLNGYAYRENKLHIWLAKRASHLACAPGKLDNLAAGGLPCGLTPQDNISKEAWEEARISPQIMQSALSQHPVSYHKALGHGVALDTMFVFDLELPEDFEPKTDGEEIESFICLPVDEVYHLVKNTEEFKYNSALVIIDFLIRKKVITKTEPDYHSIIDSLYRHMGFC